MELFLFKEEQDLVKHRFHGKRDQFYFDAVNYPSLDNTSYIPKGPVLWLIGLHIIRLVAFVRL